MILFVISMLILLLACLSTAQYAGILDVNDPSCPRRNGPHLHYEWIFDRAEGYHCYNIPMEEYHYYLSMKASRRGPALGAPDVFGICKFPDCRASNCTYWKVASDETSDNVHMPCMKV
ncbi:hypothetical protein P170DRAFT_476831 [Aspergillus steynii IBT 23096]|uniref:Uncharacterized protein n=1 Tax=Aspergillus steynii IBT 23096 TaxID=1392250 RepID=A0A2I2G5N3_9EURO|nr:uncharacterized protein P170DRAFT_476831 [Aspergillus steynii IBT 23096]PLB48189.1 hypothetical protein P170DRAFT_476831 [Aspergillus steynii IBT 23096]